MAVAPLATTTPPKTVRHTAPYSRSGGAGSDGRVKWKSARLRLADAWSTSVPLHERRRTRHRDAGGKTLVTGPTPNGARQGPDGDRRRAPRLLSFSHALRRGRHGNRPTTLDLDTPIETTSTPTDDRRKYALSEGLSSGAATRVRPPPSTSCTGRPGGQDITRPTDPEAGPARSRRGGWRGPVRWQATLSTLTRPDHKRHIGHGSGTFPTAVHPAAAPCASQNAGE